MHCLIDAVMTEIKKIQRGLAQDGRQAYQEAKSNNNAFILIGNSIYRIGADGSREMVKTLPSTKVKAKKKKYTI